MAIRAPLTIQQKWLWEVTQRYEHWRCVAGYTYRLSGVLNVQLLRQSFEEVIRRHDSLRTKIDLVEGIALQEVREPHAYRLDSVRIAGSSSTQIEVNARHAVEEIYDAKMDLSVGPLWSARLIQLSENEHWLVLAMHRLIGDCASVDQTYREIRSLYGEWAQGRPSPLKDPSQYVDYAIWQQKTACDWLTRHDSYWTKRLVGATPIQWPDDPRAAGGMCDVVGKANCFFGVTLSAKLRDLARKARTLAATLMLTIYVTVLWQLCRQKDFVLPFNIAGRESEQKSVIGYFSYALYLRMELTGNETFRELLGRVGREFFTSLSHQDFGRMAIRYPDLLSGALFQWVTWHSDDALVESASVISDPLKPAIVRVPVREFGEGLTVAPPGMTAVEVTFFDTAEGLCALGSYRADRFAATTMEKFMADLQWAAEHFVHNPDAQVAAISGERGNVDGTARQRRDSGDRAIQCDTGDVSAG